MRCRYVLGDVQRIWGSDYLLENVQQVGVLEWQESWSLMSVSSATNQRIKEETGRSEVVFLHSVNPIQTLNSATCTTEMISVHTSGCSNAVSFVYRWREVVLLPFGIVWWHCYADESWQAVTVEGALGRNDAVRLKTNDVTIIILGACLQNKNIV